ncbi:thiol peroxidase [Flavobacteriaceae bacterium AU392]|nr:thiol peroxidase [Flavobacteriaceae bacterium]RKM86549.1 thiol peroxidase [Flavobacteriaceae bacterium AU392]
MAKLTLGGTPVETSGELPKVGTVAPDFKLTAVDLSTKTLKDYAGKNIVLNIYPSIDTSTCATSARKFNEAASAMENTVILCISRDLPFAQSRYCSSEGLENIINLADYKDNLFSKAYGVNFIDGPFETLHSRCIVVINSEGIITHTEQVQEIANEPNYDAVMSVL